MTVGFELIGGGISSDLEASNASATASPKERQTETVKAYAEYGDNVKQATLFPDYHLSTARTGF